MPANDTHRREPLLAGWWISYPGAYGTTAMPGSSCSGWTHFCVTTCRGRHRRELLLAGWWIPSLTPTRQHLCPLTTPTAASHCSRGGGSPTLVPTGQQPCLAAAARGGLAFVSPRAGGATAAPWLPAAMMGPQLHRREQLLTGWNHI